MRWLTSRSNSSKFQVRIIVLIYILSYNLFFKELDPPIPYTRVNHAKYMATENRVYVGTSNWCAGDSYLFTRWNINSNIRRSADYFINTGGVSIAMQNSQIVQQFQDIFDRDWNSQYAYFLNTTNYH